MAALEFSVERALAALQTPGFYSEVDPGSGEHALKPFENIDTEAGLEFYEHNFLDNTRISDILNSSFERCSLARYRTFSPDPERIYQFRRGGEEAGCVLVVLLWPPESEVIYYSNSLKHILPAVPASNGLWQVPPAAAKQAGCGKGTSLPLKQGGFTIQDARTLATFVRGQPITASFAPVEILKLWPKMVISTTEEMEQKLKAKQNARIGLHIELKRAGTEG